MQTPAGRLTRAPVLAKHFGLDCIKPLRRLFRFITFKIFSFDSSRCSGSQSSQCSGSIVPPPRLVQLFQFGYPPRSLGIIAAPRCINSFTNSDTSVLDLLTRLSLSAPSVDRFSTTILSLKSVLPEASRHSRLCGFATRPSRAALHPTHQSVNPYNRNSTSRRM